MQKTLRMLLTGAMIVTALTACGKDAAKKPEAGNPTDTGTITVEEGTTSVADAHAERGQEEQMSDWTKVPPLTKPQKYVRDNREGNKIGFILARDPDIGDPIVFVGIDLEGSADLQINENDYFGDYILWETTDKSIIDLRRDELGLDFRIPGDEVVGPSGLVSVSFRDDSTYEGTPEAITSLNGHDVLLQDGNYVVYYKNNHYSVDYIYRFFEDDVHGAHRYSSMSVEILDTLEEAPAVIARCREIFTFGYIMNGDENSAPLGENGEEIDLLQYRDFRDVEMEALNRYGLYLDDASFLNNQAGIHMVDEHRRTYFSGSVMIEDYSDARDVHGKIQFEGNTWYIERNEGYVNLWTPLNQTYYLELTVHNYLDTKDANELSDKEIEEMLAKVFSPDKAF